MSPKKATTSVSNWLIPTLIFSSVTVLLIVVISMQTGNDQSTSNSPDQTGANSENDTTDQPDLRDIERRDPEDPLTKGPVDAAVGLVVFSDYQCPYCAQWSHETLPLLEDHADEGDLRIEWRDINVFGDASERASRATFAAALQDEFWEYHELLFADGETRSENDLSEEALIDLADEIGLDTDQFATDLNSQETIDEIDANAQLGLERGAHSTPVFVLGGTPIVGAQPVEVFLSAYDEALASSAE